MPTIFQEGYVAILLFINIHLTCIIMGQVFFVIWYRRKWQRIARRRQALGLSSEVLMHQTRQIAERRKEVLLESCILLFTIFVVPLILVFFSHFVNVSSLDNSGQSPSKPPVTSSPNAGQVTSPTGPTPTPGDPVAAAAGEAAVDTANKKARQGIAIAFLSLLLWILISGTSTAQALLGGLTFKWLSVFTRPFQIGDRVTLKGHSGKVTEIGTFFVTLQTLDDNQISIPTYQLWGADLNSSNSGNRSSLCVMTFYLAAFVTAQQRQAAEDAIWDAIQASAYYDPASPVQILLAQTPDAIQITAKAYVASTYNEPFFTSDVTRAFLDFTSEAGITLASPSWRLGHQTRPAPVSQ